LLGRIVQIRNSAPIRQALVRVDPGGRVAQPDTNAYFRFLGLRDGRYVVRVLALGYVSLADSITLGQDGLYLVAALARPTGDIVCTPSSARDR
jgi:hypothetical protein